MKSTLFFRAALVAALLYSAATASAHDFEVNGIFYNKNEDGTTVSVTYKGDYAYSYVGEYSGSVTIPASVTYSGKTYSVTSIGDYAFSNCSGLTAVEIPNSVTSIGISAFEDCSGLTAVEIPNSVTSIGNEAFYRCSGLTAIEIPNSVTSIGNEAFYGCSGLTTVSIGNSVTSIGGGAFDGCSGLTAVEIPNSVTSIGNYAFTGCSGLNTIKVQSGNQTYDSRDNCNAIIETATNTLLTGCKSTVIPNSVTSIGNHAFYGCSGLTAVEIPNSVTSIGYYAFRGCSGLTAVEIPNSVTSIGYYAFRGCSGLTAVSIGNSVTSIGSGAFEDCSGLTAVEIPNSVTSIGNYAFSGCKNLEMVFYNAKNCTGGSHYVFYSYKVITFVIGAEVEQIGDCVLKTEYYNDTKKIVSHATTPPVIASNNFHTTSCPLYVPKDSYAKYWTADVWTEFSDMRQIENPVTKIELNKGAMNLATNSTVQLTATITPDNATLKDIYWSSDAPTVALVDQSGNVEGLKSGMATITAMAIDGSGVKATCRISVGEIFAENLSLNPSELTLAINQSAKIMPVITPENVSNKTVEWSSSNTNVAPYRTNSDGTISVLGAADGVATITCRTTDGSNITATCVVTVGTGAVDGIEADAVTVRGENGVIHIEGAEDAKVEVYNAAGVCIYCGTATEIPVPQRGIYVVKVAGRATKIAL